MWSLFNKVMRIVSSLIGVAMILMGSVWMLQGLNLAFRVGFMVGNYPGAGRYRPIGLEQYPAAQDLSRRTNYPSPQNRPAKLDVRILIRFQVAACFSTSTPILQVHTP